MLRRVLRRAGTQVSGRVGMPSCVPEGAWPHRLSLSRSDVSRLEEELRRVTAALMDDFLEPEKNKLIRRHL